MKTTEFTYRSPVKEFQVSWFVLGTTTLNSTDTTVKRLDRNVKTLSADISAIFASNEIYAIESNCPQNKQNKTTLLLETGTRCAVFAVFAAVILKGDPASFFDEYDIIYFSKCAVSRSPYKLQVQILHILYLKQSP